jgi:ammonium transporter Rh
VADFCTAAVLISFGAVLGKTSPIQLLIMATIEVVIQSVNEWIGLHFFKVTVNVANNHPARSIERKGV